MLVAHALATPFKVSKGDFTGRRTQNSSFHGDLASCWQVQLPVPALHQTGTSRLVEDLVSVQNLMRWIDIESEHHRYENFRSSLSAYLESCHVFSQEEKLMCSKKLLIKIEEEQEKYELLVKYEHYRGGYEAAMVALHKYYGFKLKTNNVVLPEKKFLDIYSNQNEEFSQSIFVERTCSDIIEKKNHMIVQVL
jgi:hypothetical protein